jgi:hypothetical protein
MAECMEKWICSAAYLLVGDQRLAARASVHPGG